MRALRLLAAITLTFALSGALVASAGSLTPSAAPASTMRTLEEIYNPIAGTYDSSSASASTTGNLIQQLKYITANLGWTISGNNMTDAVSGTVTVNGVTVSAAGAITGATGFTTTGNVTVSGAQALGASPLVFEGGTDDDITTTFAIADPTSTSKTVTFPNATITVNAAGDLSGTTLASNVVSSSLTSVGTLTALTVSGALAANGGITFDAATDTVGAHTLSGTLDAGTNILTNIGNTGTDFVATTGALTLAGILTANGGISVADVTTELAFSSTSPTVSTGNGGTLAFTDGTNTLLSVVDQGAYPTLRLAGKTDASDPSTCTAGDLYFNSNDATVKACTAANTWEQLDNASSSVAWSSLTAPTANLGSLNFAEYTTVFDWNTASSSAAFTGITLSITNDAATDGGTQRVLALSNTNDGGSTGTTEALLYIDNADANEAVTAGIQFANSGGGGYTAGIDMADQLIVNIGNSGTDFTSGGGLTIATDLTVSGGDITGANSIALDLGEAGNGATWTLARTIASAAGATWDGFSIPATTATISGSTNITTATGFNLVNIAQPTLSAGTALTVTSAATLYVAAAPTGGGAGPAAITSAYALWVDGGTSRFDGGIDMNASVISNIGATGTDFGTSGQLVIGPSATSGGVEALQITQGAHTAVANATPRQAIQVDTATITLADGNWSAEDYHWVSFAAPSFAGVAGGLTENVDEAATLYINAAPSATGGNSTVTSAYALWVDGGTVRIDGDAIVGGSTSSTETIADGGFSLGGDDLFVAGLLGVEGTIYGDADLSLAGGDITGTNSIALDLGEVGNGATWTLARTIASAAGATWDGFSIPATTATISGSTNITTATGFNLVNIAQPTLSAGTALTVTSAATLYVAAAPTGGGAGPAAITTAYALWADAGAARFDGDIIGYDETTSANTNVITATAGGATVFNDASEDIDFRIESDSETSMFHIDSGLGNSVFGKIGMGAVPVARGRVYLAGSWTTNFNTSGASLIVHDSTALPTITSGSSGTAATVASLWVGGFTGSGTITTAASLYVEAAPTGGSTNYGLYVDAGTSAFDGDIFDGDGTTLNTKTGPFFFLNTTDGNPNTNADPAQNPTGRVALTFDTVNNKLCVNEASNTVWICSTALADIAEWVPAAGAESGDLVAITDRENPTDDPTAPFMLGKTTQPYERRLVGVVSEYAEVAEVAQGYKRSPDYHAMTIAGRVPVKVTTENGPVRRGDPLTSSSTPGAAMKATAAGPTIGMALEEYDGVGVGKVMVFMQLGGRHLDDGAVAAASGNTVVADANGKVTLAGDLDLGGHTIRNVASILGVSGWEIGADGKLVVQEIEVKGMVRMHDTANGDVYCVRVESGILRTQPCETPAAPVISEPASTASAAAAATETSSADTAAPSAEASPATSEDSPVSESPSAATDTSATTTAAPASSESGATSESAAVPEAPAAVEPLAATGSSSSSETSGAPSSTSAATNTASAAAGTSAEASAAAEVPADPAPAPTTEASSADAAPAATDAAA